MSTASLSIDRTALSLAPLVISSDGATYRLSERGIGRPSTRWRFSKMPDSGHIHGSELVGAVREDSSIPVELHVAGASWADVEDAIDELEAALSQFAYTVTVTVEGVAKAWDAGPADMSVADAGRMDAYRVDAHLELLSLVIPVYPIAGS